MYERLTQKFILFFAMTMAVTQTWAYAPIWSASAAVRPGASIGGSRAELMITAIVMRLTQTQVRALGLDYGLTDTVYSGRNGYGYGVGYTTKRSTLMMLEHLLNLGITPAAGTSSAAYDGMPSRFSTGAVLSFGRANFTVLPRLSRSARTVRLDVQTDVQLTQSRIDARSRFESSSSLTLTKGECVVAVYSPGTGDAMLALIVPVLE